MRDKITTGTACTIPQNVGDQETKTIELFVLAWPDCNRGSKMAEGLMAALIPWRIVRVKLYCDLKRRFHDVFFTIVTLGASGFFAATSRIMIPRIPTLTRKNKLLAAHSPGTNVELPRNSSWYPC